MNTLADVLESNRRSMNALIQAAERAEATFQTPRAPGKWSPSQVTEHVARALDESAVLISGGKPKFPVLPAFIRPVVRSLLLQRSIKKDGFPKAKTSRAFDPERGPETPAEARVRLESALARFEKACRDNESKVRVESHTFGTVSIMDYAKFQGVHVRHHTKQIPAPR